MRVPWRTAGAGVSVAAAVALAAAVYGRSCQTTDDGPVGTVREFVVATQGGDKDSALALLGPQTIRYLERGAERITAGSTRRFGAVDMLGLTPPAKGEPAPELALVWQEGARAEVSLTTPGGPVNRLPLVRIDGRWLIELATGAEPQVGPGMGSEKKN